MRRPFFSSLILALGLLVLSSVPASAQDYLCDPGNEDCRALYLAYMDAEWEAMDVAFWFMEDARYAAAIDRASAGAFAFASSWIRAQTPYPNNATVSTRYRATVCQCVSGSPLHPALEDDAVPGSGRGRVQRCQQRGCVSI